MKPNEEACQGSYDVMAAIVAGKDTDQVSEEERALAEKYYLAYVEAAHIQRVEFPLPPASQGLSPTLVLTLNGDREVERAYATDAIQVFLLDLFPDEDPLCLKEVDLGGERGVRHAALTKIEVVLDDPSFAEHVRRTWILEG
jgi:hypothetical protein